MAILFIDIGNSQTTLYICQSTHVTDVLNSTRHFVRTRDLNEQSIKKALQSDFATITAVFIASVVPKATETLVQIFEPYIPHAHMKVLSYKDIPLALTPSPPEKIGIDRILNVFAGTNYFDQDCCVIDIGTAITIDLCQNKCFKGGIILPGPQMQLNALSQNTALIPKFQFNAQPPLIGTNTETALQSNAVYGVTHAINGLIEQIKIQEHFLGQVVLTGGWSQTFAPHIKHDALCPQLPSLSLCYL